MFEGVLELSIVVLGAAEVIKLNVLTVFAEGICELMVGFKFEVGSMDWYAMGKFKEVCCRRSISKAF